MPTREADATWLGVPGQSPEPAPAPTPQTQTAPPADPPAPAVPEPLFGVPRQEAPGARPVAPEQSLLLQARQAEAAEELEQMLEQLPEEPPRSSWLNKTGLSALVLGLSSLALLVLMGQFLSLVRTLSTLPVWAHWAGYAVAGLLCLLVLVGMGRFLAGYLRLQASPRISLTALAQLNARGDLRRQAAQEMARAKTQLAAMVRDYPLQEGGQKLLALGFTAEELALLARNRRQLLDTVDDEPVESWLGQCNQRFVALIDQVARRRVTRHAWLVGLKTAAAPTGLVDASIVLINAYRLMNDLCALYRLRASGLGTASILLHIFVNAYAAARLEEWMDHASQQIIDAAAQGSDGMAAFFKVMGGGVLSRAAEGGANALLLVRLGVAAMHYLRPLAERP